MQNRRKGSSGRRAPFTKANSGTTRWRGRALSLGRTDESLLKLDSKLIFRSGKLRAYYTSRGCGNKKGRG